ncbi:MAG: hypothetical protein AAGA85_07505 [Bacteroidota bacterium]
MRLLPLFALLVFSCTQETSQSEWEKLKRLSNEASKRDFDLFEGTEILFRGYGRSDTYIVIVRILEQRSNQIVVKVRAETMEVSSIDGLSESRNEYPQSRIGQLVVEFLSLEVSYLKVLNGNIELGIGQDYRPKIVYRQDCTGLPEQETELMDCWFVDSKVYKQPGN